MEKMVKEIEELRVKESSAVEEQKKLSRVVRLSTSSSPTSSSLPSMSRLDRGMQHMSGLQEANVQWLSGGFETHQSF